MCFQSLLWVKQIYSTHPVIFKVVGDERWAERSGWVNSTAGVINLGGGKRTRGEAQMKLPHHPSAFTVPTWDGTWQIQPLRAKTYSKKMSQGNGETNCQRCRSWDVVSSPVCGGQDTQHQLEGGNDFNSQPLACIDSLWKLHGGKKENVIAYSCITWTGATLFCHIYFLNMKTQACTPISLLGFLLLNRGKIGRNTKNWREISFETLPAVFKPSHKQLFLIQRGWVVAVSSQSEHSATEHNFTVSGISMLILRY